MHNITINKEGKAEFFCGENTPAWHGLGTTISGLASWEQAAEIALLNWEVKSAPVYILDGDNNLIEINGKTAIVRGDNNYVLSIMSDRYKLIQNRECFNMWNNITAPEAGGEAQAVWDTAGSLDEGRKVFAQCKLTGSNIIIGKGKHKEETEKRVLFFTSHDGSAAITGLQTPVRVVCQNTLSAALKDFSCKFSFRHTKNALNKVSEAQRILGLATEYFKEYQDTMNHLYNQKVDSEYVKGFLETLFPAKIDEEGDIHLRIGNKREAVELLFKEGKGNRGENRYDLLNGLTEWVDHHQNGRVTQTSLNRTFRTEQAVQAEQRFTRSILGVGASLKQSALDYLLAN